MLRTIVFGKTVEQNLFWGLSHFSFNLFLYLPQRASASIHHWQHLMYLFNSKLMYRVLGALRGPMHLHQLSELHCNEWKKERDDRPLKKGRWGSQGREWQVRGGSLLQLGVIFM